MPYIRCGCVKSPGSPIGQLPADADTLWAKRLSPRDIPPFIQQGPALGLMGLLSVVLAVSVGMMLYESAQYRRGEEANAEAEAEFNRG